ncbi:hypothetical protein K466DRAFT_605517 [Polyporus arcularius HHB13444]|uniref:Uncharacterized protein n=1 Tax=Polyporus arcularius HHB13444 TaxID=1314778 RepID=A0A5C3NT91_9APHY|nr:hypothetical protein K466DRAFT_605517 [Polyporus arcularius HHB13444]
MQLITLTLPALCVAGGRALVADRYAPDDGTVSQASTQALMPSASIAGTRLVAASSAPIGTISPFSEPGPFSAGIFIPNTNSTS